MAGEIRTVVFGGSFDPVHSGHLALAYAVLNGGYADEVWFMVSPMNPHKQGNRLTDEQMRLRMVELAVEEEPRFKACDFEFALPRPSYTLHTLNALENVYPDRRFILLVGADNWEKFDKWYKGDEIVARFGLLVYPRDVANLYPLPEGVQWVASSLYDVSSTLVRNLVAEGGDISDFVPEKVNEYIIENRLYK